MDVALQQPRLVAVLAALSAIGWAASVLVMPHAHHGAGVGPLFAKLFPLEAF